VRQHLPHLGEGQETRGHRRRILPPRRHQQVQVAHRVARAPEAPSHREVRQRRAGAHPRHQRVGVRGCHRARQAGGGHRQRLGGRQQPPLQHRAKPRDRAHRAAPRRLAQRRHRGNAQLLGQQPRAARADPRHAQQVARAGRHALRCRLQLGEAARAHDGGDLPRQVGADAGERVQRRLAAGRQQGGHRLVQGGEHSRRAAVRPHAERIGRTQCQQVGHLLQPPRHLHVLHGHGGGHGGGPAR
jgi:hypothetical protein